MKFSFDKYHIFYCSPKAFWDKNLNFAAIETKWLRKCISTAIICDE